MWKEFRIDVQSLGCISSERFTTGREELLSVVENDSVGDNVGSVCSAGITVRAAVLCGEYVPLAGGIHKISICHIQEKSVVNVLRCSLEECLTVGSGDHHQWNSRLLDELIDRYLIYLT